jgi:tricorn protease
MNRVATPGYLRFPHIHDDLLAFVAEDDVWLAPAEGGRAWRLTSDGGQASHPRFSPDGATIAWTSWRDGGIPEVYSADTDGGAATRRTYWGDFRTRVTGWTRHDEVLAITAAGQPTAQRTMAYAVPLDAPPRRLPFGQVNDLALTTSATVLLTAQRGDPSHWKRYRGGTAGRLWVASAEDPLFTRVLSNLNGQLAAPMIVDDRIVFLSDHEGTGNLYSATLDGGDLRRHTDHDGFYARNPATDGNSIVYHVAGDIWRLDSLAADARPRKLDIQLTAPPVARVPRVITAADHLGELDCDETGQASVVEVRGTVHWLTHADGPARALSVNPNARARLPRILGTTGKVAWITDAGGGDAIQIAEIEPESAGTAATITSVDLGNVTRLEASPDGEKLAAASHDGRLLLVDVESGEVTELAANDDGDIEDVSWSPDSAWLAWAQPGPQPLARIRLARVEDGFTVDVTDGRFVDTDPVFTVDGLYLAFLSRRTFDPIYDAHSFDLSFPFGARPYLVPLAAHTLSPFGPLPGGRPVGNGENSKDSSERLRLTVDTDGISSRVVAVPVDEARYYSLAAAKGGLLWLRYPLSGVLGEGIADPEDAHPRPALERFDLRKREASVLASEVSWFAVSGDGARLVIGDRGDVRVAPSDRKADNGSSDDVVNVDLTRARFQADPAALWRHAYAEFGRLLRRDFWTPTMSDVDWDGVLEEYRFLLDRVRTSAEFGDLLWEAAGELGTSHAYVMPSGTFSARSALRGQPAALLGADVARVADGRWIVERVLPGESSDPRARSPFAAPGVAVREGDEILAVDGRPLDPVHGPWPALAGTHGKPVELTIRPADPSLVPRPPAEPEEDDADEESAHAKEAAEDAKEAAEAAKGAAADAKEAAEAAREAARDAKEAAEEAKDARDPAKPAAPAGVAGGTDADAPGGAEAAADAAAEAPALEFPATRRVVIVPLYDDRRLRYQDWVSGRRQLVRLRSDGRVGYLHVPDMMGEGWAHLHRDLRAEMGRDALIVDVRGNRGGHTSQLIVEKLARRIIGWKIPRHLRPYSYPQEARRGPLVALTDEFAGSDGDIVTAAIKTLGLGPVIGARTWGGVVGIDGSGHGLVDGTRITIPRYASWFTEFGWSVENYGVDPDTEVLITPDDWAVGHDPQLEVAVDRALALLEENPRPPLPDPSTGPAKRRPPLPPRPLSGELLTISLTVHRSGRPAPATPDVRAAGPDRENRDRLRPARADQSRGLTWNWPVPAATGRPQRQPAATPTRRNANPRAPASWQPRGPVALWHTGPLHSGLVCHRRASIVRVAPRARNE